MIGKRFGKLIVWIKKAYEHSFKAGRFANEK
jgi:hypothetical protein